MNKENLQSLQAMYQRLLNSKTGAVAGKFSKFAIPLVKKSYPTMIFGVSIPQFDNIYYSIAAIAQNKLTLSDALDVPDTRCVFVRIVSPTVGAVVFEDNTVRYFSDYYRDGYNFVLIVRRIPQHLLGEQ